MESMHHTVYEIIIIIIYGVDLNLKHITVAFTRIK